MATYLRLESIDGDSSARGHEKWIEVESISWGAAATSAGSGRASGKVTPEPLRLTTRPGRHSPLVLRALVDGTRLATARVERTIAVEPEYTVERWELTHARVVAHTRVVDDDAGTESITLKYGRVSYSVLLRRANGQVGDTITVTWDVPTGATS